MIIATSWYREIYPYITDYTTGSVFVCESRIPYRDSSSKKTFRDEELHAIYQDDPISIDAIEILQLARKECANALILPYRDDVIIHLQKYFDYWDDKEVSLSKWDKITFVDGGAYIGDSIEHMLKSYPNKISKIYAFEPDQKNFESLKKTVENLGVAERSKLFKNGMWNANEVLHFSSSGDMASYINGKGESTISVVTIDDVVTEVQGKLCIKMDIEGAELQALEGAKNTIRKYKPELAICVYHNSEDVLAIPTYIKSLCPEYKCILRSGAHMICYASVDRF